MKLCFGLTGNTAFTQKLVFPSRNLLVHEKLLSSAERTQFAFPLLRKCEKRYKKARSQNRNFFVKKLNLQKKSFVEINFLDEKIVHFALKFIFKTIFWKVSNLQKTLSKFFGKKLCQSRFQKSDPKQKTVK